MAEDEEPGDGADVDSDAPTSAGNPDAGAVEGDDPDSVPRDDPLDAFPEDHAREDAEADPFARLGAGPGREGDPFDRLADTGPAEPGEPSEDGAGGDPVSDAADAPAEPIGERPAASDEDPFADLAASSGDPFEDAGDVFGAAEGGADVWERMEATADVEAGPEADTAAVSKHSYCERCEYFSPPPEVACSHEGTEILEFTDMETVRLRDCPIVEERRALEEEA